MPAGKDILRLQTAIDHQSAGRFADAISVCKLILHDAPDNFDCIYLLAMLYAQQGKLTAAIDLLRRGLKLRPDVPEIQYNLAVALTMAGNHDEAARNYEQVLKMSPHHVNARNNLAATLMQNGRVQDALDQYDKLIALTPAFADGYNNRGMALEILKRFDEAVADYDKAVELNPNFPEAYVNRGNALAALRRFDDALASYSKAIAFRPNFADAYSNAGNIYFQRKLYAEALAAYNTALSLRPGDSEAKSMRLSAKMHLCDWSNFDAECSDLISCIKGGLPIYTFVTLAIAMPLGEQHRCARLFSKAKFPPSDKPLWRGEMIYSHDRIRIAYLSGDFREHATAHLAVGLFEQHDRSAFEVTGISYGPDENSPTRHRIRNAFEHFIEVPHKSDQDIAELVREHQIDIAVDLMGYTQNARPAIFALRPAPIQVSYLGYLGPMGAEFMDYVIADKIALPFDQQSYYNKRIVHLPNCFLASDNRLKPAPFTPSRQDVGLPADGFVFCSFNNSYKLGRPIFELWMRLLRAVEGSVLWLLQTNPEMVVNLRREARRCGIDPGRIIFARHIALPEHLARQRLADLFLDTTPYNAGATAAFALWAGLPVLTVIGKTFVGRMAASMLHAVGLPELVTESLADYEALALKIAREPAFCAALKDKLAHNLETCPFFDTERFARNIEAAYRTMWQAYRKARPPAQFTVEAVH
jgi:protein O-GlcNAc transferase